LTASQQKARPAIQGRGISENDARVQQLYEYLTVQASFVTGVYIT